jgi:integrase
MPPKSLPLTPPRTGELCGIVLGITRSRSRRVSPERQRSPQARIGAALVGARLDLLINHEEIRMFTNTTMNTIGQVALLECDDPIRQQVRRAVAGFSAGYSGTTRLDRHAASRIVRRLAKRAGIDKRISPHSLRHSFITAALDAGVPLRDMQEAASHSDPRTTMRYYRGRGSLDRHAT